MHRPGYAAAGAFHFGMAAMADNDQFIAGAMVFLCLHVHFSYERAGGVDDLQAAVFCFLHAPVRHAMGAENGDGAGGHIGQRLGENGAFFPEIADDVLVMHYFVQHIDRRTEDFQCFLDHVDRSDNAGAESAGFGEGHLHISTPAGEYQCTARRFPGEQNGSPSGNRALGSLLQEGEINLPCRRLPHYISVNYNADSG